MEIPELSHRRPWALARQRGVSGCHYCSCPFSDTNPPTIDHIVPRSKGGTRHNDNVVLACSRCNNAKGQGDYYEYLNALLREKLVAKEEGRSWNRPKYRLHVNMYY